MPIKPPTQAWPKGVWTIQFASGLRTDERGWISALQKLRPVSPNLALLGNLGTASTPHGTKELHRFFRDMSKAWEKIYWVPGVSEYSSYTDVLRKPCDMFILRDRIHDIGSAARITVMDQTEVVLEDESIVVLGATGWSPGNVGAFWLTDSKGQHPATMGDISDLKEQDSAWLRSRIAWWRKNRPGTRIVVLTHDAPDWRNVTPDVALWLSGKAPDKKNLSGMVTRNTFFCANEYGVDHYLPDRSTSLSICLR